MPRQACLATRLARRYEVRCAPLPEGYQWSRRVTIRKHYGVFDHADKRPVTPWAYTYEQANAIVKYLSDPAQWAEEN